MRTAAFADYPAREMYLDRGTTLVSRDPDKDRLVFVLAGASHGSPLVARLLIELGERVVHGVAVKPCSSVAMGYAMP